MAFIKLVIITVQRDLQIFFADSGKKIRAQIKATGILLRDLVALCQGTTFSRAINLLPLNHRRG